MGTALHGANRRQGKGKLRKNRQQEKSIRGQESRESKSKEQASLRSKQAMKEKGRKA